MAIRIWWRPPRRVALEADRCCADRRVCGKRDCKHDWMVFTYFEATADRLCLSLCIRHDHWLGRILVLGSVVMRRSEA